MVAMGVVGRGLMAAAIWLACLAATTAHAQTQRRLVYANSSRYDTLDPHLLIDAARAAPRLNLYDGLLRWLDSPGKLEPWLAEKYVISPTGGVITFQLRKGIKFHDGTELKAADVVYSVERILALKEGVYPLIAPLVAPGSTKVLDDYRVEFNLIKPSPIFLGVVPDLHVVNAALVKRNEINNDWGKAWLARNEAGSGSFRLKSFDPSTGFTAERFAEHWNPKWGAKPVDEIEFRSVSDASVRVSGVLEGEYHLTDGLLPLDQLKRLREAKNIAILEADSLRLFHATIHNGREPLNDPNFRKALAHVFDYGAFIKGQAPGAAVRNPVPLPLGIWGAPQAPKGYAFDLDKAKEFMAKAKPVGREITIGSIAGQPVSGEAAALLQAGLEKIGVASRIVSETWPEVAARMRDEQKMFDVLFLWKSAHYVDPASWIGEMYDCDLIGSRNSSWYCNREVDKLLKEALLTFDPEARGKSYEKAVMQVLDDAAGLFISSGKWLAPVNRRVSGIRYSPVGDAQDLRWASMD